MHVPYRTPRRAWPTAAALAFAGVALLLRASHQTPDGLDCALAVRLGTRLWHPHHLLYGPLARLLYLLLHPLGADAILAGQVLSALGAAALLLGTRAAGRRLGGAGWGLLAAWWLLCSRGLWVYATQVEAYAPAAACLVWTVWAVLPPLHSGRTGPAAAGDGEARRLLGASLLLAAAILLHQTNVLLVPAAAWAVLRRPPRPGRRTRGLGLLLGPAALIVAVAYLVAWRLDAAAGGGEGPLSFALRYALTGPPGWRDPAHLSLAGVRDLLASQGALLVVFPARLAGIAAAATGLLLTLLAAWHLRALRRRIPPTTGRGVLLLWLALYHLFFLWWLPSDTDFFLATLPALLLLGALALRDRVRAGVPGQVAAAATGPAALVRGTPRPLAAVAVLAPAAILAVNLLLTVLPLHRDPGPAYREAAWLAATLPPGCAIAAEYETAQNLRCRFGREPVFTLGDLRRRVADGAPPPAWAAADCRAVPADLPAALLDRLLPPAGGAPAAAGRGRLLDGPGGATYLLRRGPPRPAPAGGR